MRRDGGDLPAHMAVIQASQSELVQHVTQLQENFGEVVRELAETRRKQQAQQQLLKSMLEYMQNQAGGHRKWLSGVSKIGVFGAMARLDASPTLLQK